MSAKRGPKPGSNTTSRATITLSVTRQVKIQMNVQASYADVSGNVLWEEAAIMWLKTKGITIDPAAEVASAEAKAERMTA